jgi:hypothetical protein
MLTKHLSNDEVNQAIFYVYIPPAMLNAMKSILEDKLKITNGRIKIEFTVTSRLYHIKI